MRPEILNPLFAEVEAMKGVGPQVAKLLKRLKREALSVTFAGLDIGTLSQLPDLKVMARSTVFRFKGSQDDPRQIGCPTQFAAHVWPPRRSKS